MNSIGLHTSASLQPALSPRLQRAVRLLQMSSQDFAQVVRDELGSNPFLEPQEHGAAEEIDQPAASHEEALPGESWGADAISRTRHSDGDGGVFDTLEARTSLV